MTTHSGIDPRDRMDITPDWADDSVVYIDGRLTRNRARYVACFDGGWYRDTKAFRCYMRLLTDEEAEEVTHGEYSEFWWVCEKDAPGAFAMWRVEVAL